MLNRKPQSGFTLIELLVTLAVAGIVLTQVVPSMSTMIKRQQLKSVVDQLTDDLRFAQSESIKRNRQPTAVTFTTDGGSKWCYGVAEILDCDCTNTDAENANACALDVNGLRTLKVGHSKVSRDIRLTSANFGGGSATAFDPVRGLATAGQVVIRSPSGVDVQINVSALGRISVCVENDKNLYGYSPC